jgi:large subunit ribosomal protein L23
MALFGSKKNTKEENNAITTGTSTPMAHDLSHVLRHARITEKATMHSQDSVYTFDVAESANKHDIALAVKKLYSVTPRMVRIVHVPSKIKRSMRTGRVGTKKGGKKAYVYLKKGETINI